MLLGSVPLTLHSWGCICPLTSHCTTPPISASPASHATADLPITTIPPSIAQVEAGAREHSALKLAIFPKSEPVVGVDTRATITTSADTVVAVETYADIVFGVQLGTAAVGMAFAGIAGGSSHQEGDLYGLPHTRHQKVPSLYWIGKNCCKQMQPREGVTPNPCSNQVCMLTVGSLVFGWCILSNRQSEDGKQC